MKPPSRLKAAAAERLQEMQPTFSAPERRPAVDRVIVEVELDGQRHMVAVGLQDGALGLTCTCGQSRCAHVGVALSWVSESGAVGDADAAAAADAAESFSEQVRARGSSWPPDVRTVKPGELAAELDTAGLAAALDDVVTAVVRAGTASEEPSASADEAIERLFSAAPKPLPLGVARWVGRLKRALSRRDVMAVARVLDGASRFSEDLRTQAADRDARRRFVSWLGALAGDASSAERISDRTLLEVAREWLDGIEFSAIERRYLVDLQNGETYREERFRGAPTASLGPCPRLVSVGLAHVELGIPPRRIHLMQYSVSVQINSQLWGRLSSWASRGFDAMADMYREAVDSFPGLAEPFALVAPARIEPEAGLVLLDAARRPLPLATAEDPSASGFLQARAEMGPIGWLAGRLIDAQGTLMLRPLSVAVQQDEQVIHALV